MPFFVMQEIFWLPVLMVWIVSVSVLCSSECWQERCQYGVPKFAECYTFLSFASGGELILWKLHLVETGETWKVLKTLS